MSKSDAPAPRQIPGLGRGRGMKKVELCDEVDLAKIEKMVNLQYVASAGNDVAI